jgi:hypothetical protein
VSKREREALEGIALGVVLALVALLARWLS